MATKYNFKEEMNKPERLAPGHRMCAGCGGTIAVRAVLRALHEGDKAVIGNATGCLEVSSFMYPYTAWEDSYIHNAFENAGGNTQRCRRRLQSIKEKRKITGYKLQIHYIWRRRRYIRYRTPVPVRSDGA